MSDQKAAIRVTRNVGGEEIDLMPVSEHERVCKAARMVVSEWNMPHHGRAERDDAVQPLIYALAAALDGDR